MTAKARVAIVTRTRDRDMLLRRALDSLAQQTYQDFVQVVVNDGGDRKALDAVLSDYPTKNRVVVDNQQPDMIKALNVGIRAVDSDYVAILDDDDTWAPERLEKTVAHLDKTGAKAVVVKMNIVIEEMADGKIHKLSEELHPQSGEGEISLFKQCYQNYLSNGIITYRRDVYEELDGYDETLATAEDWDFGIRLMLKYDVDFLREEMPLFFYHQRPRQKGTDGNSVHAGVLQQEKTITILRNRYLRNDINKGRLGVGYIMNAVEHDKVDLVRLEGHINRVKEGIEANISREVSAESKRIRNDIFSAKMLRKMRSLFRSEK
jgi:glycosyltransferase involved in cell wall biosynthesis